MVDEFYFLRKSSHDTFVENWKKVEKKIVEYGTKVLKSEAAKILLIKNLSSTLLLNKYPRLKDMPEAVLMIIDKYVMLTT